MKAFAKRFFGLLLWTILSSSVYAQDIPFPSYAKLVSPSKANVGDTIEIEISSQHVLNALPYDYTAGPFFYDEPQPLDYAGTQSWVGRYESSFSYIDRIEYRVSSAGNVVSALDTNGYWANTLIPAMRLTVVATTVGTLVIVPSIKYSITEIYSGSDDTRERYCYGDYTCGDWGNERSTPWSFTWRFEGSTVAPGLTVEVQAVPEPGAWALWLAGLGLVAGLAARGRHRMSADSNAGLI